MEVQQQIDRLEERVKKLERTVAVLCRRLPTPFETVPTFATNNAMEPVDATTCWVDDYSGLCG